MELEEIEKISAEELSRRNMYELSELSAQAEELFKMAKSIKAKVADALELRFKEKINDNLISEMRTTGTTRFREQGFEVVATVAKKVEWDATRMWDACKALGEDFVKAFIKMTYKIYEKDWLRMKGHYQEILMPCRKIIESKPTIKIVNEDVICI